MFRAIRVNLAAHIKFIKISNQTLNYEYVCVSDSASSYLVLFSLYLSRHRIINRPPLFLNNMTAIPFAFTKPISRLADNTKRFSVLRLIQQGYLAHHESDRNLIKCGVSRLNVKSIYIVNFSDLQCGSQLQTNYPVTGYFTNKKQCILSRAVQQDCSLILLASNSYPIPYAHALTHTFDLLGTIAVPLTQTHTSYSQLALSTTSRLFGQLKTRHTKRWIIIIINRKGRHYSPLIPLISGQLLSRPPISVFRPDSISDGDARSLSLIFHHNSAS